MFEASNPTLFNRTSKYSMLDPNADWQVFLDPLLERLLEKKNDADIFLD
jgi:hypothetical protein